MWNEQRLANDPEWSGYIVEGKTKCGKKNCHCMRKNSYHRAYWLMWREYVSYGKTRLRKKYLKKTQVYSVQRKLAIYKGGMLCATLDLPQMQKLKEPLSEWQEDIAIEVYLTYGKSKHVAKILKDGERYLKEAGLMSEFYRSSWDDLSAKRLIQAT